MLHKSISQINTTCDQVKERLDHYILSASGLRAVFASTVNEEDALNLWLVIRAVIERAAKLTAVNLSSAVLKTDAGKNPRYPVIINADGTTFYKTEFLKKYTEIYLHEFLEKKHGRFIKMVRIDDSPVLGAAIAGLSV